MTPSSSHLFLTPVCIGGGGGKSGDCDYYKSEIRIEANWERKQEDMKQIKWSAEMRPVSTIFKSVLGRKKFWTMELAFH